MSTHISSLEHEVEDKRKIESALKECEKSRAETVNRLEHVMKENATIMSQVNGLQKGLCRLKKGSTKNDRLLADERDEALGEVRFRWYMQHTIPFAV